MNEPEARPSMNHDSITLEAGQVILQWPARISSEDYDDLKDWLEIMSRRVKRAIRESGEDDQHPEV